jgi:hypothetical protein
MGLALSGGMPGEGASWRCIKASAETKIPVDSFLACGAGPEDFLCIRDHRKTGGLSVIGLNKDVRLLREKTLEKLQEKYEKSKSK